MYYQQFQTLPESGIELLSHRPTSYVNILHTRRAPRYISGSFHFFDLHCN